MLPLSPKEIEANLNKGIWIRESEPFIHPTLVLCATLPGGRAEPFIILTSFFCQVTHHTKNCTHFQNGFPGWIEVCSKIILFSANDSSTWYASKITKRRCMVQVLFWGQSLRELPLEGAGFDSQSAYINKDCIALHKWGFRGLQGALTICGEHSKENAHSGILVGLVPETVCKDCARKHHINKNNVDCPGGLHGLRSVLPRCTKGHKRAKPPFYYFKPPFISIFGCFEFYALLLFKLMKSGILPFLGISKCNRDQTHSRFIFDCWHDSGIEWALYYIIFIIWLWFVNPAQQAII